MARRAAARGIETTEFWLVALALVSAGVLTAIDRAAADQWLDFARWVIPTYIAGRTVAKAAAGREGDGR